MTLSKRNSRPHGPLTPHLFATYFFLLLLTLLSDFALGTPPVEREEDILPVSVNSEPAILLRRNLPARRSPRGDWWRKTLIGNRDRKRAGGNGFVERSASPQDNYCSAGWYKVEGYAVCCMVGSFFNPWTSLCEWSCTAGDGNSACGITCCLAVHSCNNGICELNPPTTTTTPTADDKIPSPTTKTSPSTTESQTLTPDPKSEQGFDKWDAANKVGLVLGVVSSVIAVGGFVLWMMDRCGPFVQMMRRMFGDCFSCACCRKRRTAPQPRKPVPFFSIG